LKRKLVCKMIIRLCALPWLLHVAAAERASLALDTEFSSEAAEAEERTSGRGHSVSAEEPDEDEIEGLQMSLESMRGRAQCVEVTQPQAGLCAYNRSLGDDLDEADEKAVLRDPRSSLKALGYTMTGFKAKLWQIGRATSGNRRQHVELSGTDAQQIVRNMYGIKVVKVPKKCFRELKAALTYAFTDVHRDNLEKIKEAKPRLVQIIKSVATGCENFDAEDKWKGEGQDQIKQKDLPDEKRKEYSRSFILMKPVMLGYWGILPELTYEKKNLLAVRVYDELRVLRGDTRLRQIWHYARCHMVGWTEERLRQKVIEYKSESNRQWHLENLVRLYRIMKFRRARLEWVELDADGTCISAPERDPLCLIAEMGSYSSANFRTVLMFQESHWQSIGKAIKGFFHHPLLALKKYGFRFKDRWQRGDFGTKLGILLAPLVGAAQVGGIVLGTVTAGSTTLGTLLASFMATYIGLTVVSASTGLANFLVSEIFGIVSEPVKGHLSSMVTNQVLCTQMFQRIFVHFDDNIQAAILATKTQMELTVEQLLTDPRVLKQVEELKQELKSAEEEHWIALEDSLEDEVRRYVEDIVREEFRQELVFDIEQKLTTMVERDDPSFGWLKWASWQRYHAGKERQSILDREVGFVDTSPAKLSWLGNVTEIPSLMEWRRHLKIRFSNQTTGTVVLTSAMQRTFWVKDVAAYKNSKVEHLLWHDWREYRRGSSSKLKGKEILFDGELQNCQATAAADACLSSIQAEDKVHLVDSVSRLAKLVGGSTSVTVRTEGDGTKCSFVLEPAVKRCLRVRDHKAYAAFQDDRTRSGLLVEWQSGRLNATTSIVDRILDRMRRSKETCGFDDKSTAKTMAIEKATFEEEGLGAHSVELDVAEAEEDEEADQAQGEPAEDEEEMKHVANVAHASVCLDEQAE